MNSECITPEAYTASARQWLTALVVCLLTLLAAALRLWQAGESLWLDELHTAWTVDTDWQGIGPRANRGNYGPFYFWGPWLCTRVFGLQEWAVRLPSLLAGIGLTPATYWITSRWFGCRVLGCLAAGLITIDPNALFYSLEARPYALIQIGAVLHMALLFHLRDRSDWRWWLAFCLLGGGLFHLHYTTALLFAAEATVWVIWSWRSGQMAWAALLSWIGIAALAVPTLAHVQQVAARRQMWNLFIEVSPSVLQLFPFVDYLTVAAAGAVAAVGLVACLRSEHAVHEPIARRDKLAKQTTMQAAWLLVAWLVIPLGIAYLSTRFDIARLFYRRYTLYAYPTLPLLVAGVGTFTQSRRGRLSYAITAFFAANLLLGPGNQFLNDGRFVRHSHEQWRQAVYELSMRAEQTGHDWPILVRTGLIEEHLVDSERDLNALETYLLFPVSSIYQFPDTRSVHILCSSLQISELAREQLQRSDGCWLLIRGTQWFEQNRDMLLGALESQTQTTGTAAFSLPQPFGNLLLIRYGESDEPLRDQTR